MANISLSYVFSFIHLDFDMTSVDCIYSGLEHFAQPSYMFCALELIWVLAQIHGKCK
jgi:hypothetical protein